MKPEYRSIWWPRVHEILVWTPSPMHKIANGDIRDALKRVKFFRDGHTYEPSAAYKRKLKKAANKGRLPIYIQQEKY